MKRDAVVALTEPGESNVNHLRVLGFGVLALQLKAGAKSSVSHLAGEAAPADGGGDRFNFAPGNETVTITYQINDIGAVIDKAELQLFARFTPAALWTLDLMTLGPDWVSHGVHEVEWDGRLPEPPTAAIAGQATDRGFKHKLTDLDPKEVRTSTLMVT